MAVAGVSSDASINAQLPLLAGLQSLWTSRDALRLASNGSAHVDGSRELIHASEAAAAVVDELGELQLSTYIASILYIWIGITLAILRSQ